MTVLFYDHNFQMSTDISELSCERCKDIKELILASQSDVSPNYTSLSLLISTIKDLIIEPVDEREKNPDFYAKDNYILVVNLISLSTDSLGRLRGKASCTFATANAANKVIELDPSLISDRVAANLLAVTSTLGIAKSLGIKSIRYCVRYTLHCVQICPLALKGVNTWGTWG